MKLSSLLLSIICICCCSACSNSVDFGEQYKKVVYIVNSNNKEITTTHMIEEQSRGNIAVYCAGSEFPNHDVKVHFKIDKEAMEDYNQKEYGEATSRYMTCIPENAVTFDSDEIVIKSGEPTGLLYFTINTTLLDPSVNNTLPLTITDASGYEINPDLQTIFYKIQLQTEYSGAYSSQIQYMFGGEPTATYQLSKELVAAGATKLKIPGGVNVTVKEGNDANYFILDWDQETNQVTLTSNVSGFSQLGSIWSPNDEGEYVEIKTNYYNPETKEFILYYTFGGKFNYEILKKK